MKIAKRVFLFLMVNLLVVLTISILMSVLGVQPYLTAYGINYQMLIITCALWGFGGAFISLALSRVMAKWMMGVKVIDPNTSNAQERWLLQKVYSLSQRAGLTKMPEVGYYESPELNAFATGPTKNRALVAVSSGLLQRLDEAEVEGVIGHEVAHVANGDMVTMTLVQGVINTFVMVISRVIAFAVSQGVREENRHMVHFVTTLVLDMALSFLGFLAVAAYSRHREFRADADGARIAGREKMVSALAALRRNFGAPVEQRGEALANFKINGSPSKFARLFSTHPPLEERIARLQQAAR